MCWSCLQTEGILECKGMRLQASCAQILDRLSIGSGKDKRSGNIIVFLCLYAYAQLLSGMFFLQTLYHCSFDCPKAQRPTQRLAERRCAPTGMPFAAGSRSETLPPSNFRFNLCSESLGSGDLPSTRSLGTFLFEGSWELVHAHMSQ